ncbi:MAG: hypothetical protein WCO56_03850 [Verrucomicrobiota bacterium]
MLVNIRKLSISSKDFFAMVAQPAMITIIRRKKQNSSMRGASPAATGQTSGSNNMRMAARVA